MSYGTGSHQMYGAGGQVNADLGYGLPLGARFVGTPRVLAIRPRRTAATTGWATSSGCSAVRNCTSRLGWTRSGREKQQIGGASNGVVGRASIGW